MSNSRPTQAQRVLDYIEQFGSITQYEALKDLGIMITVKNRFGENCSVKRYSMGGDLNG